MRSWQIIDRVEVVAENGIVAAMHPLAAEAGMEVLQQGGNAADAAVAAGFAVGVVEPFMSGLGGAAYALVHETNSGRTVALDGCVQIPAGARPDMFELLGPETEGDSPYGWTATKDNAAESGYRSAIIPGAVATLGQLLRDHGTMPLDKVIAPALRLAREGFVADWYTFANFALEQGRLRDFPTTKSVFYRNDGTPYLPHFIDGHPPQRLVQTDLAATLELIAHEGTGVFYRGEIASAIADHLASHGGLVTEDDLAGYQVRVVEPHLVPYRDFQVAFIPINSGGPTVAEALNILEGFDIANLGRESATTLHLTLEAIRMALADRFAHLGDPAFAPIPLVGLLSKAYAAARRAQIHPDGPAVSNAVGDPWPFEPGGRPESLPQPSSPQQGGSHTTHLTVVDPDRNMVSLTLSLGYLFGSGVTVPGTGVILNNGMMWFDPEPDHVNSIEPGKRALHAGTPALVFDQDGPLMALGAPGGRAVMTAVLQVILNVVDFGMTMQPAISAPRIHSEGEFRPAFVDRRIAPAEIARLETMGHPLVVREENVLSYYFGRPNGILIDRQDGLLRGGVTPHQVSTAIGY
jgi:gamma-glutamyltranspeptidase/glutathione hydrolase